MKIFVPLQEILGLVIQLSLTVGLVVAVFVIIYAILLPFLGKKKHCPAGQSRVRIFLTKKH